MWVLLGVVALALVLPSLWPSSSGEKITYTQFMDEVRQGEVTSITVNNSSNTITGKTKDGQSFTTTGGGDRSLSEADEATIREQNVDLEFKTPGNNWLLSIAGLLLPVLLIIGFFVWMQRRAAGQMGNVMSIGRSRAKAYDTDKPSTTFADIAGYEGVKQEITEVVDFLRMPDRFREIGARVPKGMLLVGPPGTGKTLFARAVAGEAGVGFLSVTGSDFMEMFVGVGASRVRDLFQQARRMGRAIIFIDEIDSIGRKRGAGLGGGHDEREQTLNQMLSEMDGFETVEGIVILAATNRPDILDPALLRPGRFDRQIVVPLPEFSERRAILDVHARDKRMSPDVDLDIMAKATPGMSGADLANLVNEAALVAVRRGSKQIERIDFENARDRVVLGARRESLVMSAEERRATAYHEGGHALLATVLPNGDPLHKVTILPRGMALGVTWSLPQERHTYSKEFFEDTICKAMGGRVAEKIVFDHVNSGAANDLEQATSIARRMVREWGMSDRVGPMAWSSSSQAVFLGEDLMTGGREYSDDTAKLLDEEVARILTEQEQRATEMITKHRRGLELIAESLLDEETIDGRDVANLIQQGLTESGDTSAFRGNVLDPESDEQAASGLQRDVTPERLGPTAPSSRRVGPASGTRTARRPYVPRRPELGPVRPELRRAGVGAVDGRGDDAGFLGGLAGVLVEVGGDAQEQRAAVVAAEHAGVAALAGGDLVEDLATLGEADHPVAGRVGDPHRTVRIEAHPVGGELDGAEGLHRVGGRRHRTEGGPVAARPERPVGGDVERAHAVADRLADHQRLAVGRDRRAVREHQRLAGHRDAAVGIDPHQRRRLDRVAGHQVEAEVPGVGDARRGDDHVVDVAAGNTVQVGVLDELAGLLLAQDLAVPHRHHEHPPIGEPAEPGRLLRDADDLLGVATGHHRHHAVRVEVGEVQPPVAPSRALRERHLVDHRRQLASTHAGDPLACPAARIGGARQRPYGASRAAATAAHRSVAVTGPAKLPRTTPA